MRLVHPATLSLSAILFWVPFCATAASLSTYVTASVNYYGGSVGDNDSAEQAAAIGASAAYSNANFTGNADASANIDYGLFQAYASADATLQPLQPFAQGSMANFAGSWDDIFVMNPVNAALLGTQGTATVSLLVDVDLLVNGSGHSSIDPNDYAIALVNYQYNIYVGDGYASGFINDDSVYGPTIDGSFGVVQFNYSFIWGNTIDISASIYGESSVGLRTGSDGVNSASAVVDSLHTFGWQGLSNVQDEFGNPVEYSVTSDSGTDWSMPATVVPIPAAVYLFGSGLALLGWFRRKEA